MSAEPDSDLIRAANAVRGARGLTALTPNSSLNQSAAAHAKAMAIHRRMTHDSFDGSPFDARFKKVGYANYQRIGENVAAGQVTAYEVIDGWMKSPPHRENLLSKEYREIGAGFVKSDAPDKEHFAQGGGYWVMHFGSRF